MTTGPHSDLNVKVWLLLRELEEWGTESVLRGEDLLREACPLTRYLKANGIRVYSVSTREIRYYGGIILASLFPDVQGFIAKFSAGKVSP